MTGKTGKKSNLAKGRHSFDAEIGGTLVPFLNRNISEYPTEAGAVKFELVPVTQQKDLMINQPKVGDVYLMVNTKNEMSTYYFNIVFDIKNDSIMMYRNRYEYSQYTIQLNRDDYFDKSNLDKISSTELKTMHESNAINAIIRNYNKENEFNNASIYITDSKHIAILGSHFLLKDSERLQV
jgi:hypothetical protein